MSSEPLDLLVVGALLLAGYVAHVVGSKTHLPRVTLLLLLGTISGPYILNLIPTVAKDWFPFISHMALAMVGFLLGERFYRKDLKKLGNRILKISIIESIISVVSVFIFLTIFGANFYISLILSGIAPATAPAATLDVVQENKAKGPLTKTLLGIVALDDIWGVILFSISLVFVEVFLGKLDGNIVINLIWQIIGAIVLGIIFGIPMAMLTGRIKKGEPTLLEAIGFVFLCAGISLYLNVSYLLSCMVLGVVVANGAKHHEKPFREIKGIIEPFLAVFFFLAGYSFEIDTFHLVGIVTLIYIIGRVFGKVTGGFLGGRLSNSPDYITNRIGLCLIPQAGVALGMALLVKENLPELGSLILPIIIASTIIFEIIGPVITLHQLKKSEIL